ncbi:hypothetical protein [Jiangella asiatica]|uniref:Uncharacterized protein n=1 Tax=Jiangella asiatica TaxID=2530372 RepID=A0A4R5CVH1_9ACTN|nr:hypothetical protein [Jiangella asiatica]TDE03450.1 hypothetical protein E1269_20655 [Jiangella asiatica]
MAERNVSVIVTQAEMDELAWKLDTDWGCSPEHAEGTCFICDTLSAVTNALRDWWDEKAAAAASAPGVSTSGPGVEPDTGEAGSDA